MSTVHLMKPGLCGTRFALAFLAVAGLGPILLPASLQAAARPATVMARPVGGLVPEGPRGKAGSPLRTSSQDYDSLATELADTWMARISPESMRWSWGDAVLGLGLQAVYARSQDPVIVNYLRVWVTEHIEQGIKITKNDEVVPCTGALFLYEQTGDETFLAPVAECDTYLDERAPRLDDGSIAHTMITPNQIWVDSLFMAGTVMDFEARILGDTARFAEEAAQFQRFNQHLFASSPGLYWHMYDELIDQHLPVTPTFWGRGNGWVLASLAMLLTDLPSDHPDRAGLEDLFRAHAEGIMAWQDPSGLWWTVINRPGDSYLETSATGLFSFGLLRGAALGVLGQEAREAGLLGLKGLESRITYDAAGNPVVTGISLATNPGPYVMYAHVPQGDDVDYGVGAVMLALTEGAALGF